MSIITNRSRVTRPRPLLLLKRWSPISSFVRRQQSLNCYKNTYYSVRSVTRRRRTSTTTFNGNIRKRRRTGLVRARRSPSRFVLFCKYIYIDIFFFVCACVRVEKSQEREKKKQRDVRCMCTVVIVCFAQVFEKDSDTHCCVLSVCLLFLSFLSVSKRTTRCSSFPQETKTKNSTMETSYVRFCF